MRQIQGYSLLVCIVSAMDGLLFGYGWVVIGGARIFCEPFFGIEDSVILRGWATSSALVGCLVGALLSGVWSDKYRRKKILIMAFFLFTLSALGTGIVNSSSYFVFYHIIGGLGIGIASDVSPICIAEVSPAHVRSRLVSLNQLTIVLDILLAQLVDWQIGEYYTHGSGVLSDTSIEWAQRWMFWTELIPAGIFFLLSFVIPGNPRWPAIVHQQEKVRKTLIRTGGGTHVRQALKELTQVTRGQDGKQDYKWKAAFRPKIRKALIVGIVLTIFQQWCGINVIFNYAHEIFPSTGYTISDVLIDIVVTGITNMIFISVVIYTVDKWRRRTLVLIGSAGLTLIYLALGACYFPGVSGLPILLLVVLATTYCAISLAPVVRAVLSEISPVKVRGMAMALSAFLLWVACSVLIYTFPVLNKSIGAKGTFWLYGGICLAGFLFIRWRLPEIKGKTLGEVEKELIK